MINVLPFTTKSGRRGRYRKESHRDSGQRETLEGEEQRETSSREASHFPLASLAHLCSLFTASALLPKHSPKPTLETTQIMNISTLWILQMPRLPRLEDLSVQ